MNVWGLLMPNSVLIYFSKSCACPLRVWNTIYRFLNAYWKRIDNCKTTVTQLLMHWRNTTCRLLNAYWKRIDDCKTAVTQLLMHWCSLVLSHRLPFNEFYARWTTLHNSSMDKRRIYYSCYVARLFIKVMTPLVYCEDPSTMVLVNTMEKSYRASIHRAVQFLTTKSRENLKPRDIN